MLFNKALFGLLPAVVSGVAIAPLEKRDVCFDSSDFFLKVYLTVQTIDVPTLFNTYVPQNGQINIGGIVININNAPTNIQTVINVPSVQTVTQTNTVTSGGAVEIRPTFNIINYPVYISTFIQQNTIINNNGATIIVNNAPTTIITTAVGTSTVTSTVTSTITSPVGGQTIIASIAAAPLAGARKVRRQAASSFLNAAGQVSTSCTNAARLVSSDGRLFSVNPTLQYSANANDTVIPFVPSANPGSIQTTFTYGTELVWLNQGFTNGAASFFLQGSQLFARLVGANTLPAVQLVAIDAARCVNGQIVDAATTTTTISTSTSVTSTGSTTSTGTVSTSSTGTATTSTGSTSSTGTESTTSTGSTSSTGTESTTSTGSTSSTGTESTTSTGSTSSTGTESTTSTGSTSSTGTESTTTTGTETTTTGTESTTTTGTESTTTTGTESTTTTGAESTSTTETESTSTTGTESTTTTDTTSEATTTSETTTTSEETTTSETTTTSEETTTSETTTTSEATTTTAAVEPTACADLGGALNAAGREFVVRCDTAPEPGLGGYQSIFGPDGETNFGSAGSSDAGCFSLCANTATCIAASSTDDGLFCFLMEASPDGVTDRFYSAVEGSAGLYLASADASLVEDTAPTTCAEFNGAFTGGDGREFVVRCDTAPDEAQGVYVPIFTEDGDSNFFVADSTIEDCFNVCASNPACVAADSAPSSCFLYEVLESGDRFYVASPGSSGLYLASADAAPGP